MLMSDLKEEVDTDSSGSGGHADGKYDKSSEKGKVNVNWGRGGFMEDTGFEESLTNS